MFLHLNGRGFLKRVLARAAEEFGEEQPVKEDAVATPRAGMTAFDVDFESDVS